MMNYKVELIDGNCSLYSSKIRMYVLEDVPIDEVKIALATEIEYKSKLEIVKLFMTFPHGFRTKNDKTFAHEKAIETYETWYHDIHQRIGFLDEYYALIDKRLSEITS